MKCYQMMHDPIPTLIHPACAISGETVKDMGQKFSADALTGITYCNLDIIVNALAEPGYAPGGVNLIALDNKFRLPAASGLHHQNMSGCRVK